MDRVMGKGVPGRASGRIRRDAGRDPHRWVALAAVALWVAACSSAAAPTPQIVYVTPQPTVVATPTGTPTPTPAQLTPAVPTPAPVTHSITGTMAINALLTTEDLARQGSGGIPSQEKNCRPDGDYDKVVAGVPVVVLDQAGTVVGATTLKRGSPAFTVLNPSMACQFAFGIGDVPDAAFYSISVGSWEGPTYSLADMQAMDWQVSLTLGY